MRTLLLLLLAAHPYSLGGIKVGDNLATFQLKHVNAFCGKEAITVVVCDQDDAVLFGYRTWMSAVFVDDQLRYVSFTLAAGLPTAKKISDALHKQYGEPPAGVTYLPHSLDEIWHTENVQDGGSPDELELSYTSAADNGLGHPVIRISLADKGSQNN